jgi:transcriptional regulator with XRE-family HTH domain
MNMKGQDLKLARIIKGVSQYKLAAKLGIPAPRLSEIERGKHRLPSEFARSILNAIEELSNKGGGEAS